MSPETSPVYRDQPMTALIQVNPAAAKQKILTAYEKAKCEFAGAAKLLKCSVNTLHRWVEALEMDPVLERLKARAVREGWHHTKNRNGGRPPTKRANGASRAQT